MFPAVLALAVGATSLGDVDHGDGSRAVGGDDEGNSRVTVFGGLP